MRALVVTLQVVRIFVLGALLTATAGAVYERSMSMRTFEGVGPAWTVAALVSALVVVAILVGRRTRHPWAVLAVEAVLAAGLAFTHPMQWFEWFGLSRWTDALATGALQPLAITWLCVAVATAFHQLRAPRPDHPTTPAAAGAGAWAGSPYAPGAPQQGGTHQPGGPGGHGGHVDADTSVRPQ